MHVMMLMKRDAKLVQIVLALGAAGGFASRLHGRQQQRDKNTDDCDHYQQLDKGKTAVRHPREVSRVFMSLFLVQKRLVAGLSRVIYSRDVT